ncbi:YicC/YloC family endoribonuclease [Gallaecimonas mangrovi]|uniref:YicC/YloC family endoribonuclease n=1 Tax=Gallaecimonas mangrovi TaxID=2291597 RepID=UPI000E207CE0|nr:YicC/YloC family endoribonuclease [Gallaecimonas mangrovi]
MTYSMTAFARKDVRADWGTASWEIRSVNQRYLETYFRLPDAFRSLDPVLREKLRAKLSRGKVEVQLRYDFANADANSLAFNKALADMLMARASELATKAPQSNINVVDILRWPGVMNAPEADLDAISEELLAAFDDALEDFIAARGREGDTLKVLIESRLEGVLVEVAKVREKMPEVLVWQRERMQNRFEEAKVELEPGRLEQEMVMLASRIDVAEELDRLESHVKETRKIFKGKGAIGRRLDFMMQEFNREANTLGSKSINSEITASSVELKVLIEQMREQIQNIE